MHDAEHFAVLIAVVALATLLAVLSNRLTDYIRVPAPAIFLVAAAVASDIVPDLGRLPIVTDQRIVTIALVFILFDGGMHIGWNRLSAVVGGVVWLGVAGTLVTAAALAAVAHYLLGFGWHTALLIGTALAPTDPAVVFSVLGRREIAGRSGTLLEGESGANDPVGIALMVALLGATGSGLHATLSGAGTFALQMVVGLAFGVVGGYGLLYAMRRFPLPNEALYSLRTIAGAALIYGVTTALHGSGFLAVFLAGILIGDERAPYKREIERFVAGLASLGEIVAFTVLGLTVSLRAVLRGGHFGDGLVLAALLILIVRPVLVGLVLGPIRLSRGERLFVLWSGLKGAVPILLGTFVVAEHIPDAPAVYAIIFIVVTVSVVLQGGLVPTLAVLWKVPMRVVEPEPFALGMRFREQPEGLRRYYVARGSRADGRAIADLDIGDTAWISMISRDGQLVQVRGATTLVAGDEVLVLADDGAELDQLFGATSA